ncbi:MAG: response regulator transcription factor [Ignavibacteria bacterium]|nr:response regulator transcription factor [Ignavibacteria bacterium]
MIKALLVDDERLARVELRRILEEFTNKITVVGEAANKREVTNFLASPENPRPDVIFLDINMPRGSGFEVLEDIDYEGKHPICIVFVTAYSRYAVRAFTVNALDYIVKPVDVKRLELTLARLQIKMGETSVSVDSRQSEAGAENDISDERDDNTVQETNVETLQKLTPDDFVFVTIGKKMRFVPVPHIVCITSDGNYSEVWLSKDKRALILRTMNEWESILPPSDFFRIHRSTIVNRAFIDNSRPLETMGGSVQIYVRDIPEPFAVSRRYLAKLKERIA